MGASHWVAKPKGAVKARVRLGGLRGDLLPLAGGERSLGASGAYTAREQQEHPRWDPKDGELCLARSKSGETLMEDRSDSDVQIDRRSWV